MPQNFDEVKNRLQKNPAVWLVSGCAGFIGSNLVEALLLADQKVIGLDNFLTGFQHNLDEVKLRVSPPQWNCFTFVEGDICDLELCHSLCAKAEYVLHQAALGSVPRSIKDPLATHKNNVDGFLNMVSAAYSSGVQSFTYASSSSVYGDHAALPKVEETTGALLSPYAATKYMDEVYAGVFATSYGFKTIGLRYFNVFGPRQDPNGAYAAVIPKWAQAMLDGEQAYINGDGLTSRDFCFIDNVVQANVLAATACDEAKNQVYNVAMGDRTTLNELFELMAAAMNANGVEYTLKPGYRDFRSGDIRHSQADIGKAKRLLGYEPQWRVREGIQQTVDWYTRRHRR